MNAGRKEANGSIMIICLMVLAILGVTSLWALKIASLNRMTSHNYVQQVQAFYMAEAGIALAVAAIGQHPLWRGDETRVPPSGQGYLDLAGLKAVYAVTVFDATDDGNGQWDAGLAGGTLRLLSEGRCAAACQTLSCRLALYPALTHPFPSPKIAAISAGDITISGISAEAAFDELGRRDVGMVRAHAAMPKINHETLIAMAGVSVDVLDNEIFEKYFKERSKFWRDAPGDTIPYITWVRGNLNISGNKRLWGIFFVTGDRVILSGDAKLCGILYAPKASRFEIPPGSVLGPQPIMGQVLTGAGGVQSSGSHLGIQLVGEYVDAFNDVSSEMANVSIIPGSWHCP